MTFYELIFHQQFSMKLLGVLTTRVSQMCQKFKIPISHLIFPLLTSSPFYKDQNFVNIWLLKVAPSGVCVLEYRNTIKLKNVHKIYLNPLPRVPIFTLCLILPPLHRCLHGLCMPLQCSVVIATI